MGLLGKVMRKRRLTRRMPESSRLLMIRVMLMMMVMVMLNGNLRKSKFVAN